MILFDPILMATSGHSIATEFPELGTTLLYVLGITLVLFLNAFFVASEFAIVKVRRSQLDSLGGKKERRRKAAIHVVEHMDRFLSANQLGITFTSLAMGFLGEPFVSALLCPLLYKIPGLNSTAIFWISVVFAYASFTFLHVVIGELVPKSIAIRRSLPTALAVSRPLMAFYGLFAWVIALFNSAANLILRTLFRINPADGSEEAHSSEELAFLVAESRKSQHVTETEREILINALELNDIRVKDVMTPRSEVVALDLEKPFEDNLNLAIHTTHTRFPLVKSHLDNTLGLVHVKDFLKLAHDEVPDLNKVRREIKHVPETMPLDVLLKFFLRERAHLAMVVDEYGDSSGLIFLDNVLEEIVGDIQDEFDNEPQSYTRVNKDEFIVEGSLSLIELGEIVKELDNIESGDVTTVGGYITEKLERLPELGETIVMGTFEAKVTGRDSRRVGQIHFRRLKQEETAEYSEEHNGASTET